MAGKKYGACLGAIQSLQGLLPAKYRVTVSSLEYEKATKHQLFYTCYYCMKESEKSEIKIVAILLPIMDRILSGKITEMFWQCPKCHKENILSYTEISETTLQEPYFLKIVPKPPKLKDGLHDRSTFHIKMEQWVRTTLAELEAQMAQFRDDNWQKSDEFHDDTDIDTDDEENDGDSA